jgi:hypothetical protein
MNDRRTSERVFVQPEIERLTPEPIPAIVVEKPGERLIVPPDTLDRVCFERPARRETEEQTEPMRLSFLALLAERDPGVQARLNRRITPVLEVAELDDIEDDDRPTDPMILTAKFSG